MIWWCKVSPALVILAAIAGSLVYAVVMEKKVRQAVKEEKP